MRLKNIPNLAALRAFEATVRHGSVVGAAAEVGVTPGAVSRAVREMEASLGFPLFVRGNRVIMPTAAAHPLADEIRGALERIAGALDHARDETPTERPLVLSCEPTFLIRWLIPRLGSLERAIGVSRDLRLVSAGGPVPFVRERIDLAIRRADFDPGTGIVAEPFLDEHVGPVCRPELAEALGRDGALRGVLLHTATRPDAWRDWGRVSGIALAPSREVRFEHFYLSLQAAVAGAGMAIGPIALVADDLASGVLVAPRGFAPDGSHYALIAPRAGMDEAAFSAVLEWLRAETMDLARASTVHDPIT